MNGKNVCMVVYSYYLRDPRVRREAEALVKNGYNVTVICLRMPDEKREEVVNGVRVVRLPMQTAREGKKLRYIYQYSMFFLLAFFALSVFHLRYRFAVVHTHSLPDFIVFTGIIPKIMGAKLILDLHEAMPEIYLSKMGAKPGSFFHKIFLFIEQVSSNFADAVITVSEYIKKIFVERGMDERKITVIWNTPDIEEFVEPLWKANRKIVFAGNMTEYFDFDALLDAVKKLDGVELHIYGDGIKMPYVKKKAEDLGILDRTIFHGYIPHKKLIEELPEFSIGIVPPKNTIFTKLGLGNKSIEYTLCGLPVVAAELPGIRSVFDENCFYFYRPGNANSLAYEISSVLSNPVNAIEKVKRAQARVKDKKMLWKDVQATLLDLYANLMANKAGI
ncbi:MAG: glycosyltransferase family 4 protein [Thermoplasmata archaeon]